jgi:hypothetical protein
VLYEVHHADGNVELTALADFVDSPMTTDHERWLSAVDFIFA